MFGATKKACNLGIWDLINIEEYCSELSKLYNIEFRFVLDSTLNVIKNAKKNNANELEIVECINDTILSDEKTRTR